MKRLILASFCLLYFWPLGAFSQEPQDKEKFLNIQEITTQSGITAWLVEDHSLPIIAMDFAFEGAGTKNDTPEKQGLVRLMANTMDEGAGDLDAQAFQKELNDLSISLSFGSDRDDFIGSLKTLSKNKERAFELLKMALYQPRFDQEALDRMREANIARIKSSLSEPEWAAARIMNDMAFAGHSYALNSGGTLASLPKITREDLLAHHKAAFGKKNLSVAIVGDITPDRVKRRLEDLFGLMPDYPTLSETKPFDIQNPGQTYLYKQDIPQTIISIMQPALERNNPDYYTFIVMNHILGTGGFGSRLMEEVREKRGLAYGIYSGLMQMDDTNALTINTATKNESAEEALALIKENLEILKTTPVSEDELKDAKSYLIGSMPLALSSTSAISGLVLSLQLKDLPIDTLDKRAADIEAVTIEDIERVAATYLHPDALTTVLVGNPALSASVTTIESLPNVE